MDCPVCDLRVEGGDSALENHVYAHFDEEEENTVAGSERKKIDDAMCFVCDTSLGGLDEETAHMHVNGCLDGPNVDDVPGPSGVWAAGAEESDAGPSRVKDIDYWKKVTPDKDDRWWDESQDDVKTLPTNFSPGVIKTLASVLALTHARYVTKAAVLCHPAIMHMHGAWMFDKSWGCGYRNTLMTLSALLMSHPQYRPVFSIEANGAAPGVHRVQGWIEEAWDAGFDPTGREQLKGKLLGTRKWIGTSDIAAMFLAKGIPCELYDFPKPTTANRKTGPPTHQVLQDWVIAYFDGTAESEPAATTGSAFDVLMASKRGSAIRMTGKMPLVLQHSGHSRTIVGYEVNNRGDTNLLLFDPGKPMPKELRKSSLESLSDSRQADQKNLETSTSNTNANGKRDSAPSGSASPTKKSKLSLEPDEEVDADGWVKKKKGKMLKGLASSTDWQKNPVKALKTFRVNLSALSSHTEYQILAFPGGPLLNQHERLSRRILTSTPLT